MEIKLKAAEDSGKSAVSALQEKLDTLQVEKDTLQASFAEAQQKLAHFEELDITSIESHAMEMEKLENEIIRQRNVINSLREELKVWSSY